MFTAFKFIAFKCTASQGGCERSSEIIDVKKALKKLKALCK